NKLRPTSYENNYANMAAAFVVETERWNLSATLFPAAGQVGESHSAAAGRDGQAMQATTGAHGGHGGTTQPVTSDGPATVRASNRSQTLPFFIRGLSAATSGSAEVEKNLTGLKATQRDVGPANIMLEVRELEITALAASKQQDHNKAAELMKKAIALEEQMGSPSGPPPLVKPSHELYGEILLRAGKPEAAVEQFNAALLRQPNRARSLLGAARATAQSGDQPGAAAFYARLLDQWKQADEDLPELREAQDYLKKARP
ncbi:MAG: tetratricopeptide repeat protein, partial [Pyrinomonadaceae bacterium]